MPENLLIKFDKPRIVNLMTTLLKACLVLLLSTLGLNASALELNHNARICAGTDIPADNRMRACSWLLSSNLLQADDIPAALSNRGYAYLQLEQYDRALEDFSRAIELRPNSKNVLFNRAVLYREIGQYEDSIDDLDEVIKQDPGFAEAWYERGIAYAKTGETKLALDNVLEASKLNPELPAPFIYLCDTYSSSAINELAIRAKLQLQADLEAGLRYLVIETCTQALKLQPKFARGFLNRGNAYRELGQYDRAISDYDASIRLKPDLGNSFYNRALAFQYLGQFDRAQEDFDRAKELSEK